MIEIAKRDRAANQTDEAAGRYARFRDESQHHGSVDGVDAPS
jgi:hypothetical protein